MRRAVDELAKSRIHVVARGVAVGPLCSLFEATPEYGNCCPPASLIAGDDINW